MATTKKTAHVSPKIKDSKSSKTLWASGTKKLNDYLLHLTKHFTVGNDPIIDEELLPYDIEGSLAHARMLVKIGILTKKEMQTMEKACEEILILWEKEQWHITLDQEDGHTAIELYLTEHYGDLGKKIHTGRSRNDQSLIVMRLYQRDMMGTFTEGIDLLISAFKKQSSSHMKVPMPGYTHMQRAMPTTVGTWLGSFADALEDLKPSLFSLTTILDQSPLGSAAGFGITGITLDRKFAAKELGFATVQDNPIYCAYSRGEFELRILEVLSPLLRLIGKFAADLLLFTTTEYGFFSLGEEFSTGSSIMPQKRNQDVLELLRGSVGMFAGYRVQIEQIVTNKPSGYNRDFQLTKEPFMRSMDLGIACIEILSQLIPTIVPNKSTLEKAMTPELYATDAVLDLVKKGVPFRDAYVQVKKKLGL